MIGAYRTEGAPTLWELLNLGAPEDTEWMRGGLCAQTDPEEFYPAVGQNAGPAKAVCAVCPVRDECLAYALSRGERHGVWGGHSERERRALRRTQSENAGQQAA